MIQHRIAIAFVVILGLWSVPKIALSADEVGTLLDQLAKGPFEKATLFALEGQPDDGRIMPSLHAAFEGAKSKNEKQWIASTLLRLGDSTQRYSDFLINSATEAIEDASPLFAEYGADGRMIKGRFSAKFEIWCQANEKDPRSLAALQFGTYPEDVLVLARAQDPKAKDILRQALQSSNPLVMGYAVQGLGRLQDVSSIPLIAKLAENLPAGAKTVLSMNLPWYVNPDASVLMEQLTPDPKMRAAFVRQVQAEQLLEQRNALRRLANGKQ
jgi:hypothetical protein